MLGVCYTVNKFCSVEGKRLLSDGTSVPSGDSAVDPSYVMRDLRGKRLEKYKAKLKLNDHQRDLLIGCILGDGGIGGINRPVPWIKFEQKIDNRDYINHLYGVIKPFVGSPPKVYNRRYYHRDSPVYRESIHFRTYSHPCFLFYKNAFSEGWIDDHGKVRRRKIVPLVIHRWLNPRSLTYWFIDDGSKEPSGYVLHTQGFTHAENKRLASALGSVFGFSVNIQRDRQYYKLYITASSRDRFTDIVSPYVVDNFSYKLHF